MRIRDPRLLTLYFDESSASPEQNAGGHASRTRWEVTPPVVRGSKEFDLGDVFRTLDGELSGLVYHEQATPQKPGVRFPN